MTTLPEGVATIAFNDTEKYGHYGLQLVTNGERSKVFVATDYTVKTLEPSEYRVLPDNHPGAAARVWAESVRALSSSANTKTLAILKRVAATAPISRPTREPEIGP